MRMMEALLFELRAQGSRGVYLQMHEANARARRFYAKLGFEKLDLGGADLGSPTGEGAGTGGGLYLGKRL